MQWGNILRGLLIGVTDLVPGVSGGTVAFILGIYDRLLEAISGFFSKEWKKHIGFLIPLAIGVGLALLLFSRLIDYLLETHPEPTQFLFMGLIIGVLPFIFKEAGARQNFKSKHIITLIVLAGCMASLGFIKPDEAAEAMTTLSSSNILLLFLAGWLASMAMLLPGISGSFVLLLIGVYPTAIKALKDFNLPIVIVIGTGVIIGFIVSSKVIRYLLTHFKYMTYAVIIGLILGSFFIMFPGIPNGMELVVSIITFLLGLTFSAWFSSDRFTAKTK